MALWLRVGILYFLVFSARTENRPTQQVRAEKSEQLASCIAPKYRQFDFWVGNWDAWEVGSAAPVAHVRVNRILDGCALWEQYEGANGNKGQSFSVYDTSRRVWHQSWVTNRGQLLVLEGQFQAGEMVLRSVDQASGVRTLVRGVWKPVSGGVRETAVTSTDSGRTWKPWFDLWFRPAVAR